MVFFDHPANADWLLPLVKLPLLLISGIFSVIGMLGWGNIVLIAIVIALFTRNIMGPARA